ncbi:hypothetical protein [Xanthocytophaga agilis]|uniref:Uncharacterized protein n=1 Tax=Xanthocytophaga agilis TaxID=3048010 RepID=A0AAE3RA10_9BACT|nr:hypothetical protein [Xanthocytophaga agilis]MDJ1505970.1 hypothetical protein [Xanthocytophaga agilis]
MLDVHSDPPKWINYSINAYRVLMILLILILALVFIRSGMLIYLYNKNLQSLISKETESVHNNGTINTFFIVAILLAAAILLSVIAHIKRNKSFVWHWFGLSVGFFLLAFYEATDMYAKFDESLQKSFQPVAMLFFQRWIVPIFVVLVILFVIYTKFLTHLSLRTRIFFIATEFIYITSTFVEETIRIDYKNSLPDSLSLQVLLVIADGVKMLGGAIFIFALLDYMNKYIPRVDFQVKF